MHVQMVILSLNAKPFVSEMFCECDYDDAAADDDAGHANGECEDDANAFACEAHCV